jgi:hydroxypyruvate isomerase
MRTARKIHTVDDLSRVSMKRSVCLETVFTEVPFVDRFELVAREGFEYVEFWTWTGKDVHKIKRICGDLGLKIASFSGDQDYSMIDPSQKQAYIQFIKRSLETAAFLECPYLVVHSDALDAEGRVPDPHNELSGNVKFVAACKVLSILGPLAEEFKITIVLEALNSRIDHIGNFLVHTRDSVDMIRQIDSSYIKVLYDVYHMQISEGNILDTLSAYFPWIGYIHVADTQGRHEPGTGEINYASVFRFLRERNFQGIVGFELYPSKDSKEVMLELLRMPIIGEKSTRR